jgi:hypothetical protein
MPIYPLRTLAALAATVVLAGCPGPAAPGPTQTAASTAPAAKAVISGTLSVPASIISTNGAGIISTNGGGIISTNGAGIVAQGGGNLVLLAVKATAVAGAKVYLADIKGVAMAGGPTTTTDAGGKYQLEASPGLNYIVVAEAATKEGKPATFQTLVRPAGQAVTADLSAATTLATAAAVKDAPSFNAYDATAFQAAVDGLAQVLADAQLPDFTDAADVRAKADPLVQQAPGVQDAIAKVRADFGLAKPTPDPTCSKPQEHYLRPTLDGATVGPRWAATARAGDYTTEGGTDPGGVSRLWIPVGCDVTVTYTSPEGKVYVGTVRIEPGSLDTNGQPIGIAIHAR